MENENIIKNNPNMKGGFSLLEIAFSIILMVVVLSLSMIEWNKNDWYSSVNKMNKDIYTILDKGVMNNVTGYINSSGGDCSTSAHYNNISAGKVIDCNEWDKVFPYDGTKSDDGTESYVHKLLKTYTDGGEGCKLYIDDLSSDSFYYFIDCSNLNYDGGASRYKTYIEEKILSFAKESFSILFQGVDRESIGIDNDTGGTISDGMLRILIKK